MQVEEGGEKRILGKGIVFNQRSQNLGGFIEIIDPRALDGTRMEDMLFFYNHDGNFTLASLRNKTGSVTITGDSADYDILLDPENKSFEDFVWRPVKRRDVTGSSFMFDIDAHGDEWDQNSDGLWVRYVRKIANLYEMGPVSMPAYQQTTADVALRSLDQVIAAKRAMDEQNAFHFRQANAQRRFKRYTH